MPWGKKVGQKTIKRGAAVMADTENSVVSLSMGLRENKITTHTRHANS